MAKKSEYIFNIFAFKVYFYNSFNNCIDINFMWFYYILFFFLQDIDTYNKYGNDYTPFDDYDDFMWIISIIFYYKSASTIITMSPNSITTKLLSSMKNPHLQKCWFVMVFINFFYWENVSTQEFNLTLKAIINNTINIVLLLFLFWKSNKFNTHTFLKENKERMKKFTEI